MSTSCQLFFFGAIWNHVMAFLWTLNSPWWWFIFCFERFTGMNNESSHTQVSYEERGRQKTSWWKDAAPQKVLNANEGEQRRITKKGESSVLKHQQEIRFHLRDIVDSRFNHLFFFWFKALDSFASCVYFKTRKRCFDAAFCFAYEILANPFREQDKKREKMSKIVFF